MGKKEQNIGFLCEWCGALVEPVTNGSFRNHCPFCLYSKHVDDYPGDRRESCGGMMEPVGITFNTQKGYQIVHKCLRCGEVRINKIAQDTIQADDLDQLLRLPML